MEIGLLNERKKSVFNEIVNSYLNDGSPIGSKTLSSKSKETVSSSSLRNIMAELEEI